MRNFILRLLFSSSLLHSCAITWALQYDTRDRTLCGEISSLLHRTLFDDIAVQSEMLFTATLGVTVSPRIDIINSFRHAVKIRIGSWSK